MDNIEYVYVLGDGDRIREKVESYLLNHDLEALATFSQSLTNAISHIKDLAISTMDARVIVAGGDDILLLIPRNKYRRELIQRLQEAFFNSTGVTISMGVGGTIEAVFLNLRRAKAAKDVKFVEELSNG